MKVPLIAALFLIVASITIAQTSPAPPNRSTYQDFQAEKDKLTREMQTERSDEWIKARVIQLRESWLERSPTSYGYLLLASCDLLQSTPRRADIVAREGLKDIQHLEADLAFELCLRLVLPVDSNADGFVEDRAVTASLMTRGWKKLNDAIDPKFDPEKKPALMGSVEISPESARAMGLGDIHAQKEQALVNMHDYDLQLQLRDKLKSTGPLWQKKIVQMYAQGPDDMSGLIVLLQDTVSDASVRKSILDEISSRRSKKGNK